MLEEATADLECLPLAFRERGRLPDEVATAESEPVASIREHVAGEGERARSARSSSARSERADCEERERREGDAGVRPGAGGGCRVAFGGELELVWSAAAAGAARTATGGAHRGLALDTCTCARWLLLLPALLLLV